MVYSGSENEINGYRHELGLSPNNFGPRLGNYCFEIKGFLNEIIEMKTANLSREFVDELRTRFPLLADIKRLSTVDELNPDVGGVGYKYASLMRHEVINSLSNTLGCFDLMQFDTGRRESGATGGEFFTEKLRDDIVKRTVAAGNLIGILSEGLANEGKLEGVGFERLLDTLVVPEGRIQMIGSEVLEINSVEEFITLSTLIQNSCRARAEKIFIYQYHIDYFNGNKKEDKNDKRFVVIDNAPCGNGFNAIASGDWDESSIKSMDNKYNEGLMDQRSPYCEDSGGRSMVAYFAGQRGSYFLLGSSGQLQKLDLNFPEGVDLDKLKYVEVGFASPLSD